MKNMNMKKVIAAVFLAAALSGCCLPIPRASPEPEADAVQTAPTPKPEPLSREEACRSRIRVRTDEYTNETVVWLLGNDSRETTTTVGLFWKPERPNTYVLTFQRRARGLHWNTNGLRADVRMMNTEDTQAESMRLPLRRHRSGGYEYNSVTDREMVFIRLRRRQMRRLANHDILSVQVSGDVNHIYDMDGACFAVFQDYVANFQAR
jgi:hypothetical protein